MVNRAKTIKPDVFDEIKSRQKLCGKRKVKKNIVKTVCKTEVVFCSSWGTPGGHVGSKWPVSGRWPQAGQRAAYRVKAQSSN